MIGMIENCSMAKNNNLFLINSHKVRCETIYNSKFYFIDNFYKYPRKIKKWILNHESDFHKKNEVGYNGIHFEDRRHTLINFGMIDVVDYLTKICGQSPVSEKDKIFTNMFRFKNNEFNDYENNYWFPHKDSGYTCIIYFDDDKTNLYQCSDAKELETVNQTPEHKDPWRSKEKWEKILTLNGKFNRMILFDGNSFFHGADISSKKYTRKFRMNQVIFFIK